MVVHCNKKISFYVIKNKMHSKINALEAYDSLGTVEGTAGDTDGFELILPERRSRPPSRRPSCFFERVSRQSCLTRLRTGT